MKNEVQGVLNYLANHSSGKELFFFVRGELQENYIPHNKEKIIDVVDDIIPEYQARMVYDNIFSPDRFYYIQVKNLWGKETCNISPEDLEEGKNYILGNFNMMWAAGGLRQYNVGFHMTYEDLIRHHHQDLSLFVYNFILYPQTPSQFEAALKDSSSKNSNVHVSKLLVREYM